jgi:protein-disulfide isomerase
LLKSRYLAAAMMALAVCAAAAPKPAEDKALNDKIHAYLVAHPEVLLEMQDALSRKQAAGKSSVARARAARLFLDARDPAAGPKDAGVVIALFQDYQCGHCKAEAMPAVFKLMAEHPDVRFVFKEHPIFGAKSQAAARAAIAASKQGKYLPVFKALMAATALDDAKIDEILKANGVDLSRAHADEDSPALAKQIDDVATLGEELEVEGTPTFVVGDKVILGADIGEIEQAIAGIKKRKGR